MNNQFSTLQEANEAIRRAFPEIFTKKEAKNRQPDRPPIPRYYKELAEEYTQLQRAADSEPLNWCPSPAAERRGARWREIEAAINAAGYQCIRKEGGQYRIEYA